MKRFELRDDFNLETHAYTDFVAAISMFSYCALPARTALRIAADVMDDVFAGGLNGDADAPPAILGLEPVRAFALGAEAFKAHFKAVAANGQSYDALTINDRAIRPDLARQVSDSSLLPSNLVFSLPRVYLEDQSG